MTCGRASWRMMLPGILCALFTAIPAAQTVRPRLELATVLTAYSAGRFEEAVNAIVNADEKTARDVRLQWPSAARIWIEVDATDRPRRQLMAAALALDVEVRRAEAGGWNNGGFCDGPCLLKWSQELLIERGEPDEVEHAWLLAAVALAEGVRDWAFVYTPKDVRQPFSEGKGLVHTALTRFPRETRFRLDRAMAVASRFNVTTDDAIRTPAISSIPQLQGLDPSQFPSLARSSRDAIRLAVADEFSALTDDPVVGAESLVRLGYMQWATGYDDSARVALERAAGAATNPWTRYLAQYLLAMTFDVRSDAANAIAKYEAALQTRPRAQSAALALAALELQRGNAARADELARESLAGQPPADDPWRQFLYGCYPELPVRLEDFHKKVRPYIK